jgi:hypothetical protein
MKAIVKSAVIALLAFSVFSCDTPFWELDGMFSAIEKEIKLEDGVVKGNVYSIIEYNGSLFAGAGGIYKKDPSSQRGWGDFSKPGDKTDRVVRLAAGHHNSSNYLYALTASTNSEGETTYRLYCYDGSSWQRLDSKSTGTGSTTLTVFGNNAASTTGGNSNGSDNKAYYNNGSDVYELQGAAIASVVAAGNGKTAASISAAWAGGATYFSDKRAFCSDGTSRYEGSGARITKDGAAFGGETSGKILSLWATSSYVYIGTERGASVRATTSGASVPLPGSNADAAIGSYQILSIFADETAVSGRRAIYAGAVGKDLHQGSKNNGLWGYYDARGNWNKE